MCGRDGERATCSAHSRDCAHGTPNQTRWLRLCFDENVEKEYPKEREREREEERVSEREGRSLVFFLVSVGCAITLQIVWKASFVLPR